MMVWRPLDCRLPRHRPHPHAPETAQQTYGHAYVTCVTTDTGDGRLLLADVSPANALAGLRSAAAATVNVAVGGTPNVADEVGGGTAGEVGDGSLPVASAGAADTEPADASAGLRTAAAATVKATFIATPPPPTRWEAERPRSRATAACWSPPPRRATLSRPKRWRGLRTTAAAAVNATVGGTPTVSEEVGGSKATEADDGSFPVASAAATDVQPADLQPAEASAGVE